MIKTTLLTSSIALALTAHSGAQEHTYQPSSHEKAAVYKAAASGHETIDIVVFYQPIYARKAGGYEAVQERVNQLIGKANRLYDNSGAGVTLNLVELREVSGVNDNIPYVGTTDKFGNEYPESASTIAGGRATDPNGYFDEDGNYQDNYPEYLVYEQFAGDLAGYLTDSRLTGGGRTIGSASVGGEFFSVSDTRSISQNDPESDHTLAHEVGHNFGARHEIEDSPNTGEHPVEAHAWKCGDDERTVMWSAGSHLASVFSSPLIERNGAPCGVAGEADNVSVIQGTKQSVAERRSPESILGTVSFAANSFTGSEESGEAVISIQRDGDLSESASVLVQLTSDTATSNGDVHLSHKRVEFAAGESTAQFAFPVVQDAINEGDETFNVEMHYPYRLNIDPAEATLTIEDDYAGQPGRIEISSEPSENGLLVTLNRVDGSDGELVVNAQSKLAADSDIPLPAKNFELAAYDFVFADGETQKTFNVQTQSGDTALGDREILLSAVVAGDYETVEKSAIVSDSQGGNIEYSLSTADATTKDNSVRVTVTRSGSTELSSVISVTSANGTLTAGNDFEAVDEQLVFGVNDTSASFTVSLLSDKAGNFELNTSSGESLTVTVSTASTGGGSDGNGGGSDGGTSGGSTGLFSLLPLLLLGLVRRFKPGRRA